MCIPIFFINFRNQLILIFFLRFYVVFWSNFHPFENLLSFGFGRGAYDILGFFSLRLYENSLFEFIPSIVLNIFFGEIWSKRVSWTDRSTISSSQFSPKFRYHGAQRTYESKRKYILTIFCQKSGRTRHVSNSYAEAIHI